MTKVAVVDKFPVKNGYSNVFSFEFDYYSLAGQKTTNGKVLKRDITLDFTQLEGYDYIILIGAEAAKFTAGITNITVSQGFLINDKWLPLTNPAMAKIKPEVRPAFEKAVSDIHAYIEGSHSGISDVETHYIDDANKAVRYLEKVINSDSKYIAVDTETTALYPRDGYLLGVSISHREKFGVYIDADCIDDKVTDLLQKLIDTKSIIMHNAKFDIKFMQYHLGLVFHEKTLEDTMILHYLLDETPGTHGLKALSIKYTDLGDYDRELDLFKVQYCKKHRIKQADFTYDLIPTDTLAVYAAKDTAATIELFNIFYKVVRESQQLFKVYRDIMIPGAMFLVDVEENGVPFDPERLAEANIKLTQEIEQAKEQIYTFKAVKDFEKDTGKLFNPNSPAQLRAVFFEYLKLPLPEKRTATGAVSTDKEVLEELGKIHDLPKTISTYKKKYKIKSTYIDKVILGLDKDRRLRTNFNLTSTTSGRLSSSGKLNMQQLPRDDKTVKRTIKANPGYVIISQDLKTAEMYIAAVLSGDENLKKVFSQGGDFHSSMAKIAFNVKAPVEEIKDKHNDLRQAAKAVTFGILFGSGPAKVAETIGRSVEEAQEIIAEYFRNFRKLKKWLDSQKQQIKAHGSLYSYFGRKRRLTNAFSQDRQISGHAIRSGVNFQIQSVSSDVNLLAGINSLKIIKKEKLDAKIFALVHDSIIAEVLIEHVDRYLEILKEQTQRDYGVSIPNYPMGIDVEKGEDYSFIEYDFSTEGYEEEDDEDELLKSN